MKLLKTTIATFSLAFTLTSHSEVVSCDSLGTVNTGISNLNSSISDSQATTLQLSTDIGTMADRIGTMADKIVATEVLLTDTLIVLTGNANLAAGNSAANGVVLTAPSDGVAGVSLTAAPSFSLSSGASKILLYASADPTFPEGASIALYIPDSANMNISWAQVASFAGGSGSSVYLAVKSLDESNNQSSLSNGVKITFE